jgi:hypothetical protein
VAGTCSEPGCGRPEARRGLCWGHVKQLQRYGRTFALGAMHDARTRLEEAAVQYVESDETDEAAFEGARQRLKAAAMDFVLSTARKRLQDAVKSTVLSTVARRMKA